MKRNLLYKNWNTKNITNAREYEFLDFSFGDKVYVVRFKYHGALYPVNMICNPDTKKVVMDSFFYNITIRTRK